MSALSLLKGFASDAVTQSVEFKEDLCLRRRLNSYDCASCLDSCPAGALSLANRQVQLDTEKCSGCMLCTVACPNDAFEFQNLAFEKCLFPDSKVKMSVISCTRQTQIHPNEHVVPCLGGLSLEHLLVLGLTGSEVTAFNTSVCSNCENSLAADTFLNLVKNLQKRGGELLSTKFIVLTESEQITSIQNDNRRSFLSGFKNALLSTISSQFSYSSDDFEEVVKKTRRIPKRVSLKRDIVRIVDEESKQLVSTLSDYHLEVNEDCSLCPLCTGICPTGAIRLDRSGGQKELLIDNTLCSGCGLCVLFCKQKAIKLSPPQMCCTCEENPEGDMHLAKTCG